MGLVPRMAKFNFSRFVYHEAFKQIAFPISDRGGACLKDSFRLLGLRPSSNFILFSSLSTLIGSDPFHIGLEPFPIKSSRMFDLRLSIQLPISGVLNPKMRPLSQNARCSAHAREV